MQTETVYTSGEYMARNPTWHSEDSEWKARRILKMLDRHGLKPARIAEVGCGAGLILKELHSLLPETTELHGYEVSPQAFELSARQEKSRLHFHLQDLTETEELFDLLLVIDVFEHVEDYMGFLRRLNARANRFIFHIPLDLSAQTVMRGSSLIRTRNEVGHLHYFTEETALATVHDTGYEVLDYFFTARGIELGGGGLKRKLAKLPRKLLAMISPSLASRLLGGFSLLVLAKPKG